MARVESYTRRGPWAKGSWREYLLKFAEARTGLDPEQHLSLPVPDQQGLAHYVFKDPMLVTQNPATGIARVSEI